MLARLQFSRIQRLMCGYGVESAAEISWGSPFQPIPGPIFRNSDRVTTVGIQREMRVGSNVWPSTLLVLQEVR